MAEAKKKKAPVGDLAVNRRAWHDYAVLDKIECGIVLSGTEVKVVRHGEASLAGAYGAVLGGELYVVQMNIPVYAFGNRFNHRPQQNRKLLVHRKEVEELRLKTEAKGLTLIPLRSFRCGSTSRTGASSLKWACAAARPCTTSATRSRRRR